MSSKGTVLQTSQIYYRLFLTLLDDPGVTQQDGKSLWNGYMVNEEGTPAKKKVLVESGILKTLLHLAGARTRHFGKCRKSAASRCRAQ